MIQTCSLLFVLTVILTNNRYSAPLCCLPSDNTDRQFTVCADSEAYNQQVLSSAVLPAQ